MCGLGCFPFSRVANSSFIARAGGPPARSLAESEEGNMRLTWSIAIRLTGAAAVFCLAAAASPAAAGVDLTTGGASLTALGDLPGGTFSSQAFGISGDGSVVVGRGTAASGGEAYRWTSGDGI